MKTSKEAKKLRSLLRSKDLSFFHLAVTNLEQRTGEGFSPGQRPTAYGRN